MERWNDGTMERWNDGTMERWNDGTMERWNDGMIADLDVLYFVSPAGDIMCFSSNGETCDWGSRNPTNSQKSTVQPLVCGKMHQALYGQTGYTGDHWCKKLRDKVAYKFPIASSSYTESHRVTQGAYAGIIIKDVYLPVPEEIQR